MKAPSAMRDLHPCPPCGRQGRPGQGFLAGSIHEPRGSAPRERDHRGGDHPVPSRTRQLSPPSPRVLQREAAGGQGVALAEGAFLYAPREARGGTAPCGPLLRGWGGMSRTDRGDLCECSIFSFEDVWTAVSVSRLTWHCARSCGTCEATDLIGQRSLAGYAMHLSCFRAVCAL